MAAKLALYFFTQEGGHSRVLDADQQPSAMGWEVGRHPKADIVFSPSRNPAYSMVSKRHALISAKPTPDTTEGGSQVYRWTVTDWGQHGEGSTNGVWLTRGRHSYRIQPAVPVELQEGDCLQFGTRAAAVKVSFDIDDTNSGADGDDDGPPTGALGQTVPKALTPPPPQPASNSPWFVPSIFDPVWKWFSAKNSIEQFVFLLAIGGLAALIIYAWRL